MAEEQVKPNTVFIRDNLEVLRGLNSETVDLIYLDPPFNKNRAFEAPIGSPAEGSGFKDIWTMDDVKAIEHGMLAADNPAIYAVIEAARVAHGSDMQSYLIMMASRLIEMRRVLKATGSIFLHCDDTAGRYLWILLDAIFGQANYQNEIVWRRTRGRSDAHRFGRAHDLILFYSKSNERTWNTIYVENRPEYVGRAYIHEDELGKWRVGDLTAAGESQGDSGQEWRGHKPEGRHWYTPTRGTMSDFIIENELIPDWPDGYETVRERLDALDEAGLIYWPSRGGMPGLKRYLVSHGLAVDDIIDDIKRLEARSKERVGYPTQKPLALLSRLIEAASNPGDLVLDPFCGCATTLVAAHNLERKWIGIDVSPRAAALVKHRLAQTVKPFDGEVYVREDVPRRTDVPQDFQIHRRDQKTLLYGLQEGYCWGCRDHFTFRHLTLDHIVARNVGGQDIFDNLQLLCAACNSKKGTQQMAVFIQQLETEGLRPKGVPFVAPYTLIRD